MAWFNRKEKNIQTPTEQKKDSPDLWYKTRKGNFILKKDLADNFFVCPDDGYHERVGPEVYFKILFDGNRFEEINTNLSPTDPLEFTDSKPYTQRVADTQKKKGLKEAIRTAHGKIAGQDLMVACMDFRFIGGSMGSVVGEKIARAIDFCLENKMPLLIISQSGGARMMEAGLSLMQMAKTSGKLALLAKAGLPYISLLTHPTTGGVTASYAMLGDVNIAEPGALIGFAGPRVIRETIGKDLPKGFQTAEFLQEKGFVDFVVDRRVLKSRISSLLQMLMEA